MKNKRIFIFYILLFLVQNIFAHNERDMDISILLENNSWIYQSESKKFYRCDILNELQIIYDCYNYSDFYNKYYLQDALNIDDCKNINFVKWLFTHETDIQIKDKYIEIIGNQYSNGIPITVKQLPYYYKIKISNEEYNQYKTAYRKIVKYIKIIIYHFVLLQNLNQLV